MDTYIDLITSTHFWAGYVIGNLCHMIGVEVRKWLAQTA